MGFLSDRANASKTEPLSMPIGGWLEEAHQLVPFVPKSQLLGWAGISTVLTSPLTANTSVLPDGRQNSFARWLMEEPSILRFDSPPGGATTVDLGGVRGLGEWKRDWSLRFAQSTVGRCVAEVPVFATKDNAIINPEALDKTRAVLAATTAEGPTLRVHHGRAHAGGQIATIRMDHPGSALEHDYYMPPHPTAAKAWTIPAPAALVLEVANSCRFLTGPSGYPGMDLIYLSPDGNPTRGALRVRQDGPDTCQLYAQPVDGPVWAQLRWKRLLATTLNWLTISKKLGAASSELARFRDAVVGDMGTGQGLQPVWTDQILAPAWSMTPGTGEFPVCVRLRSERGFQPADCGQRAMDSVATFRRSFGGITGRNMMWGSRRPSRLTTDSATRQPRVRFGCHTEESDAISGAVIPTPAHFWEVRWQSVGESLNDVLLTITAITRMRDLLPYAPELQSYLDAYCDLALGYDPDIEFTTVTIHY